MTQHTIGDNLLREIRETIDKVKRMPQGKPESGLPDQPRGADGLIALIPVGGIPARDGDKLFSAECQIYREVDAGDGVKFLQQIYGDYDAPYTLPIYNPYCFVLPAGYQATTDLLKSGTRIIDELLPICTSSSSESSKSSVSSDSSGDPPPPPTGIVGISETDVRCVNGFLQVWARTITLQITAGILTSTPGAWTYSHAAGCCACGSSSDSPSSDSSTGSSDVSSSDSPSSVSSGACAGDCTWVAIDDECTTCIWTAREGFAETTWELTTNGCTGACACPEPSVPPAYPGETVEVDCQTSPSSSVVSSASSGSSGQSSDSSASGPSSDSSSSVDPNYCACCCWWYWNGITWWQSTGCVDGSGGLGPSCPGVCNAPVGDGTYYGEVQSTTCYAAPESSASSNSQAGSSDSGGSVGSSVAPSSDSGTQSSASSWGPTDENPNCTAEWEWHTYWNQWFRLPPPLGYCIAADGYTGPCGGTAAYPIGPGEYNGQHTITNCLGP
jgi:hypothetical protein